MLCPTMNKQFLNSGTLMALEGGRFLLGLGLRSWFPSLPDNHHPSFYFPDFFLKDPNPWFQHEYCIQISLDELCHDFNQLEAEPASLKWAPPSREIFDWGFQSLQEKLAAGELVKGVPYVFETSFNFMDNQGLLRSLKSLLSFAKQRPIIPYGFWDESQGILGASPELLFRLKNGTRLQTMACAGTLGHQESIESFMNDPKERHEHDCVVKGISESLSPFGLIAVKELQILNLGNLTHLMTPIEQELDTSADYITLIRSLHPTPALGTLPKNAGESWLKEYDAKLSRKRYGAPVGVVMPEEAHFYVGIRNVQWDENGMVIGAGCGVNAQSDPHREWDEIQRKIRAIKEVLSLG